MRYCGHFLIKAEGGAKNYERDHPLPLAWRPFTVVFVHRKGYLSIDLSTSTIDIDYRHRLSTSTSDIDYRHRLATSTSDID